VSDAFTGALPGKGAREALSSIRDTQHSYQRTALSTSCRNYLVPEDFMGFLPDKKAREAFGYMDDNGSGRVGQAELLNAVVQIFRCSRADTLILCEMISQVVTCCPAAECLKTRRPGRAAE